MRKTLVILLATALLGILAASQLPASSSGAQKAATVTASTSAMTPSSSQSSGQYKDGAFTGTLASGDFEDIQVAITVIGGKITDVSTPQENTYSNGRSRMIDNYAFPQLKQEVISQQSASIDSISGATYTTQTYVQSLQSAIDQAKA